MLINANIPLSSSRVAIIHSVGCIQEIEEQKKVSFINNNNRNPHFLLSLASVSIKDWVEFCCGDCTGC